MIRTTVVLWDKKCKSCERYKNTTSKKFSFVIENSLKIFQINNSKKKIVSKFWLFGVLCQ